MKLARALTLALLILGCVSTSPAQQVDQPVNADSPPQRDPIAEALGLERYPLVEPRSDLGETLIEGERRLVLDSMNAVREVIRLRAQNKDNIGRGDHAKPLGCYDAEFSVSRSDVVRTDDRAGIAARANLGKTFPAVVRFSNSEPKDVSDYRSATVGLAIKVKLDSAEHPKQAFLFDTGTDQDFIAGGLTTFVSRSTAEYADLLQLRIHPWANALRINDRHPAAFAIFGLEPVLRLFSLDASSAPMVLEKSFSSLLPVAWGNSAVKYRFEPCHSFRRSEANFSRFDASYQARVLTEFLESNDICYVMKIQARPRPVSADERKLIDEAFPIENSMAYWPEPVSAMSAPGAQFHEIARVRIKSRTRALGDRACEHLVFNPWNGLKAHQPLGSLNRARAAVYKASALAREKLYEAMPQQR